MSTVLYQHTFDLRTHFKMDIFEHILSFKGFYGGTDYICLDKIPFKTCHKMLLKLEPYVTSHHTLLRALAIWTRKVTWFYRLRGVRTS